MTGKPSDKVKIVQVTADNRGVLERIAEDVFDARIDPARLDAYLAAEGHALFVAVVAGEVVGQARGNLHLQPDEGTHLYIDNLGVAPAFKRQGIATVLIKALIAWAKKEGAVTVWVATEQDNAEGNGFYRSFGFEGKTMTYFETALG